MAEATLTDRAPAQIRRGYWRDVWLRLRRNRLATAGLAYVILLVLVALFAPRVLHTDPIVQDLEASKQPPSLQHPFGTDLYGRDIFARVVHGTRIALIVGSIATLVAIAIGVTLGGIAGFFGGWIDHLTIFFYSVVATFPGLLFILALTNALPPAGEPRLSKVYLAIGLSSWVGMCRLTRNLFRSFREQEYVLAARALGAGPLRIVFVHMVPNMMGFIVVALAGGFAGAIAAEAGISFLGFGVTPPNPSWGVMVSEGRSYLQSCWWMIVCPGVATLLAVFSFNLLADGLRDAVDPRHETL
ncbi:MAG TPA: ABC transporter permease [Armatimonadota bacterium]|nr:ABC transporter permease [Armatimonadota bacterium]